MWTWSLATVENTSILICKLQHLQGATKHTNTSTTPCHPHNFNACFWSAPFWPSITKPHKKRQFIYRQTLHIKLRKSPHDFYPSVYWDLKWAFLLLFAYLLLLQDGEEYCLPQDPDAKLEIVSLKHNKFLGVFKHVDVSENSGTPKSSILIGFSIINHPFWGTPIFGNLHVLSCSISEVIWRMWMDVMTTTLWSCST